MSKAYKKIKYLMENEAQLATIKAAFIKFRTEGFPAGAIQQPARGGSVAVALVPFCLYGYTSKYITKMSGRANGKRATLGATDTVLNIDAGTGGTVPTGKKPSAKFKAATCTVFVPKSDTAYAADTGTTSTGQTVTEDTDATPISAVRGIKYNRRLGNSYTFPFGASSTAGQQTQLDMQGYIYMQLAKGSRSVSFSTERPG